MRSRSRERRGRPVAGQRDATSARTLGGARVRLVRMDLVYKSDGWHNICIERRLQNNNSLLKVFGKGLRKCIFNLDQCSSP